MSDLHHRRRQSTSTQPLLQQAGGGSDSCDRPPIDQLPQPLPQSWSQALISYIEDLGKRTGLKDMIWTLCDKYDQRSHPEMYPALYGRAFVARWCDKAVMQQFLRSPDCHLLHIKGNRAEATFNEEQIFDVFRSCDNTGSNALAILKRLNAAGRTYNSLPELSRAVAAVYNADVEHLQAIQRYIADTRLLLTPLVMRASVCKPLAELATSISLTRVLAVIDQFSEQNRYFQSDEALAEAVMQALAAVQST